MNVSPVYLPPQPTCCETNTNATLEAFAIKYGFCGLIMSRLDQAVLEVKSLNFETIWHHPSSVKDKKPDWEIEEHWLAHHISNWGKCFWDIPSICLQQGLRWNLPIGEKKWILPGDTTYAELRKLPVFDMV